MPRTARSLRRGWCYHVINRVNGRATILAGPADYLAFLGLIVEAQSRLPVDLFGACLMPNHFHMVIRPAEDPDLSRWMHWLLTTHVRRFHGRLGSSGRIWQGRFKAFPIEQDQHLVTVLRYVERNALRAGLVQRAEHWHWGSLAWRLGQGPSPGLAEPPVPLPTDWAAYVNAPQTPAELESLRACARREIPFGSREWVTQTAKDLDLSSNDRPRGRPRKRDK
jgi:putative transposase